MVAAIFLLGLFLIALGGAGMLLAATLLPTDLGFAYFQAGTVGASTGFIVLAIGLAARSITRAAERLAVPAPQQVLASAVSAPPLPVREEADARAPADLVGPGGGIPGATETSASPSSGTRGKTSVALGGAAVLAGAAAVTAAIAPEAARNEDPRDAAEAPLSPAPGPDLFADAAIDHMPDPDMDSKLVDLLQHPVPVTEEIAAPLELVEASDEGVPAALPSEVEAAAPAVATEAEPPAEVEMPTPASAPVQSAPGLIGDEDLLALENAEPPLAPLETLEVVGSYDSGGTRFTMYSDGSVTAAGPDGERRFASLDALRRSLDAHP